MANVEPQDLEFARRVAETVYKINRDLFEKRQAEQTAELTARLTRHRAEWREKHANEQDAKTRQELLHAAWAHQEMATDLMHLAMQKPRNRTRKTRWDVA